MAEIPEINSSRSLIENISAITNSTAVSENGSIMGPPSQLPPLETTARKRRRKKKRIPKNVEETAVPESLADSQAQL